MNEPQKRALLSMLGICKKAGHAVCGTEQICEALRKKDKRIYLTVAASDISDNTKKKLSDKCAYYGAKIIFLELTAAELGTAVGKSGTTAAIGITDEGLCAAVENKANF